MVRAGNGESFSIQCLYKELRWKEWRQLSLLLLAALRAVSRPGRMLTGGERQMLVGLGGERAWEAQGLSAAAFGSV